MRVEGISSTHYICSFDFVVPHLFSSFDDRIAGECKLEFGAYMSIAASAAFYFTSIVWCCMPRSPPFCIAQGNQGIDRAPENGKDYHEFYAANTFETTTTNPPQELENQHDYYTPSGETTEKPWADSDNRPPIPSVPVVEPPYAMTEHVPVVEPPYAMTGHVPPSYDTRSMAMTTTTEMPAPMPDGFQDHTAQWMGHDTSNPMNATHDEPFANPFVVEEPMAGAVSSPGRPAYGNLQG